MIPASSTLTPKAPSMPLPAISASLSSVVPSDENCATNASMLNVAKSSVKPTATMLPSGATVTASATSMSLVP